MSSRQNELLGKFKMAAGDMVSNRGQVMEYTYIPTGKNSVVSPSLSHFHIHSLSSD